MVVEPLDLDDLLAQADPDGDGSTAGSIVSKSRAASPSGHIRAPGHPPFPGRSDSARRAVRQAAGRRLAAQTARLIRPNRTDYLLLGKVLLHTLPVQSRRLS